MFDLHSLAQVRAVLAIPGFKLMPVALVASKQSLHPFIVQACKPCIGLMPGWLDQKNLLGA